MKRMIKKAVAFFLILPLLLITARAESIMPEGDSAGDKVTCTSFVYGRSEKGRDLICYQICGDTYGRTVLLNFAIHGYEDAYAADGQVLVDVANVLIEHYSASPDMRNCRLLIVPCANPDGLYDGYTNNGFGRCNAKGVDLNRDFDANYVPYSSSRNYTPHAFSAAESRALRDLCLEYRPNAVIDFHGWLDETIGDRELAEIFYQEMGLKHYLSFSSTNCPGYFANWAHQNGALGLLVEFTSPKSIDQNKLISAIDRLIVGEHEDGTPCPSVNFRDVKVNNWFHEAVDYAVTNGLMNGTGNSKFEPQSPMTRAMLVTVLWRYAGEPMEGMNSFTDVKESQWYSDAVAWAAHNGVVTGVGDGKFDPDGKITREQLAVILFRYANSKGLDTSARGSLIAFPDGDKVSSYAIDAMRWAVAEGLINGSDGKLLPQGSATRAQVAAILMRYIGRFDTK